MIERLNQMLEHEIAAVVRYLHHPIVVPGIGRGPIIDLTHAKNRWRMQRYLGIE